MARWLELDVVGFPLGILLGLEAVHGVWSLSGKGRLRWRRETGSKIWRPSSEIGSCSAVTEKVVAHSLFFSAWSLTGIDRVSDTIVQPDWGAVR